MAWTVKRCSDLFLASVATHMVPDLEFRELSSLYHCTSYTKHLFLKFVCGSQCASTRLQRCLRVYAEAGWKLSGVNSFLLISGLLRLNVGLGLAVPLPADLSLQLIFVFKTPVLGKFLHCWAWGAFLHCWPSVLNALRRKRFYQSPTQVVLSKRAGKTGSLILITV